MEPTKEFQTYRSRLLEHDVIGFLARTKERLASPEAMSAAAISELAAEVEEHIRPFRLAATCPRCGAPLYLSDLPQYSAVCYACDENFYGEDRMEQQLKTLEDILSVLGAKKPFLEQAKIQTDGSRQPFTKCGGKAYALLVEILYCVGELCENATEVSDMVETLDRIATETV